MSQWLRKYWDILAFLTGILVFVLILWWKVRSTANEIRTDKLRCHRTHCTSGGPGYVVIPDHLRGVCVCLAGQSTEPRDP